MNQKLLWALILLFWGCQNNEKQLFESLSKADTQIDFENTLTEKDDLNILDYLYFYNGGGVALGDVNNDGLTDIYLSGNQVENKLYLNKGDFKFEDITESAGVAGESAWNAGVTMADVNGDGLLDIYVCAVVGINGFSGYNELFINNGPSKETGTITFTEKSREYGLDFESYSSSAAFLDYDLDGDLDLYLLNHAVHTTNSFGKAALRRQRNYETGDKLLRNDGHTFTDVSEAAGIYGGINGYGLGIAVADFNIDGYPDLYIGNDFHEDDYYYLNNRDGTFTESLRTHIGHTTRFSMGSDASDINHDGLPDLLSLDMLPEDEVALKSSEGDDNLQVQKLRVKDFGYHYQFTRNMLYINQPDGDFMETALLSGVGATDWSWSALFGDYDQDGHQDLFIANGIPKRPNDLDFIRFVSNEQIQDKINNTKLVDQEALELMPSGVTQNFIFKGDGELGFTNLSQSWLPKDASVSGASAYADLDNDGDLDLVVNNLNAPVSILKNTTDAKANYIKIKFNYSGKNRLAIGTKVYAYQQGVLQFKELFPSRGFQASSEPTIHFGLGTATTVDSLKVVWPNSTAQTLTNVSANQTLVLSPEELDYPWSYNTPPVKKTLFQKDTTNLGIDYVHKEDNYLDFNREKLIPYRISDRGPAFAKGDLNADGEIDLFFGGSKYFPATTYLRKDSVFIKTTIPTLEKDSITENNTASIADFNGDGFNDMLLGNGGGDFFGEAKPLLDQIYFKEGSDYRASDLPIPFQNTSVVKPFDYDGDGDLDLFAGGQAQTGKFGAMVPSYLLRNTNGTFTVNSNFQINGMVTDAVWEDFDGDGQTDLIVIGEWMAPTFFKNNKGKFTKTVLPNLSGLWQSIQPFDIDQDGDTDYLLGNWGLNTKFQASADYPLKMYFSDFDENGQTETVIAFAKEKVYYPLEGLDGLASQLVELRKRFTTYRSFAGKSIDEIFEAKTLNEAQVLEVQELASGYLNNEKGTFTFVPFDSRLQVSPLMAFVAYDFDNDGQEEVLVAGNYFGVKPYHGRFDSFPGALIHHAKDIVLGGNLGLDFTQKSARHLSVLSLQKRNYLLVVYNDNEVAIYQIHTK
ncbi:MAG: VCBS repeat-containing protein [Bacteroidota bacterium]